MSKVIFSPKQKKVIKYPLDYTLDVLEGLKYRVRYGIMVPRGEDHGGMESY